MIYLSKAKSFFDQNMFKRLAKNLITTQEDFEKRMQVIIHEQQNVGQYVSLINAEIREQDSDRLAALSIDQNEKYTNLHELLYALDGPIARMSSQVNAVEDFLDKSQRV